MSHSRFVNRTVEIATWCRALGLTTAAHSLKRHIDMCYTTVCRPGRRLQEVSRMARKLKLVKGAAQRGALIYGMRIFAPAEIALVDDAQVRLADGSKGRVTMHLIEGTRAQIRRQLMQSIDAFFELLDEEPAR